MTSEPVSASGAALDDSMSRAEMVEAWRERRRARKSSPDATADHGGLPDGFTLRRWRKAGVFGEDAVLRVERLLNDLLDHPAGDAPAPDWAVETLRECLDGTPGPQLPSAVRAVLETSGLGHTVAAMTMVHDAGLPWLTPSGQCWLEHLLGSGAPTLERDARPTPSEDVSGAFAVEYALRTGEFDGLTPALCARTLPWLPLGVVDDLIDAGVVTRDSAPWQLRSKDDDKQYLLARLAPEQADPRAAVAIGWEEAVERRRFLAGEDDEWREGSRYGLLQSAADGDTSRLRELEDFLPRPLVVRLRRVQDGALTGNWDPDMLADLGLWRLMSALWEPKAAVNPARSAFHALVALRYAYDAICVGELKPARAQLAKLVAHEEGDVRQYDEAVNMSAYLALLDGDLDTALITLTSIAGRHPCAAANLDLVNRRRATQRNDRQDPANPYLELRLPHRSPFWRQRYRDLRRESVDNRDEAARLNRAMRRIQRAEHDEDWSDIFVLPLDHDCFALPSVPPVTLVPPVEPMPRRTTPEDPADLAVVRDTAVADLLPTLLNAPRRPDHQHRTTV
ncbi:hypothetical protein [Streptomyces europaeiscabiei]|uniref:hypothetical protein n=1 Tax=Streptomyces europaeiscabiei TaxID=146819 RepID=UPI0029BC7A4C|nr:hypothetical protein [Streptomyces europaeiscabiei]MDX3779753.1 hypothetical protein [Streptomyces europaeiscabiei]